MKIYVDMDGVLTHFDKAVKEINGASGLKEDATEKEKNDMYKKIERAGRKFWSEMDWHPNGKKLWYLLKPFNPVLLSSPGYFSEAEAGKRDWIKKNIPGIPAFINRDKAQYAERDALLIDDTEDNVGAWRDAGGKAIHYTDFEDVEKKILEMIMESD